MHLKLLTYTLFPEEQSRSKFALLKTFHFYNIDTSIAVKYTRH